MGQFVEFDLITNDVDQSSEAHDQSVDDMITPNAIRSVTEQLKGSIVNMIDPEKVKDFQEVIKDGAKFGGIGHEHLYTNQDIVPALIIDEVKSIANNTKLRVTAKINEYSQRADDVWSMIQNKTLKGASIEYKVLDQHYKTVEGKVVRVIDELDNRTILFPDLPLDCWGSWIPAKLLGVGFHGSVWIVCDEFTCDYVAKIPKGMMDTSLLSE